MGAGDDRETPLDGLSPSIRDAAAERRDQSAEDRDLAARIRDQIAAERDQVSANERRLGAADREAAAEDRRAATADRASARHELAYEGLDALTGVMRRRVGFAAVQREMDRAKRTGESLVLAFVDVVGLKAINDSRGHREGDRVLREVAACITKDLRSYDIVTRVGGDEFVCTLSGQSVEQARRRYAEISVRLAARAEGARMTVGLAAYEQGDSLEDLIDRADRAVVRDRR